MAERSCCGKTRSFIFMITLEQQLGIVRSFSRYVVPNRTTITGICHLAARQLPAFNIAFISPLIWWHGSMKRCQIIEWCNRENEYRVTDASIGEVSRRSFIWKFERYESSTSREMQSVSVGRDSHLVSSRSIYRQGGGFGEKRSAINSRNGVGGHKARVWLHSRRFRHTLWGPCMVWIAQLRGKYSAKRDKNNVRRWNCVESTVRSSLQGIWDW